MDKKIKERWVKALRSGKFQQGNGLLCQLDSDGKRKYCCLGVLSQLAVRSRVIGAPETRDDGMHSFLAFAGTPHFTPQRVSYWAGLPDSDPRVGSRRLSELNDGDGNHRKRSFKEIADLIDKYL